MGVNTRLYFDFTKYVTGKASSLLIEQLCHTPEDDSWLIEVKIERFKLKSQEGLCVKAP